MKKLLGWLLVLSLLLSSSAFALNYQQRFGNDATFETLEEARVNGPAYLMSYFPAKTYVSDPVLDGYPEGTTYVYRSADMYASNSAAYRMNTNLLVFVDTAFETKDDAFAYIKDLGLVALADEAKGSVVLVTPANPATGFGAVDQYAYFQLQSAMFNLGFSVKDAEGQTINYSDNTYYGGLTYRYVIGIDGGATFINDYIATALDYVSRIAGMILVGGTVEDIREVAAPVPVYLVNTSEKVIEKYKNGNDVTAYGYEGDVEYFFNQQQPLQCVKVAEAETVDAALIDAIYHEFLIDAMRIPVIKDALYTPSSLYANYNMNQAPYSLCARNAIVNGVTVDGNIHVTEHYEDRFTYLVTDSGESIDTWYEFLPEAVLNGTAPDGTVPLWLANHGGGDDPIQFVDEIGLLEIAGKEQFAMVGAFYQNVYSGTAVMADSLAALVRYMLETYPALDASRVYVTGYSMGGGTTTTVLASHPELFAGGAPMASGGSFIGSDEQVAKLEELEMPYFSFTSTYDPVGYKNLTLTAGLKNALNRYLDYAEIDPIEYDFETYPLNGFKADRYEVTLLNNEYVHHMWTMVNAKGEPRLALSFTEGLKHALYPEYGQIAWDFLKHFSRNQDTLMIEYNW